MGNDTDKKTFTSPLGVYARIQEEMKAYFYTGSLDPLMFDIWTRDCIDKFENTYLPIEQAVMDMCDHKCELPCDFKCVREVWMCATYFKGPIVSPFVYYYQTDCRINPSPEPAQSCSQCVGGYQCMPKSMTPTPVALPSLCDVPDDYIVTHKVMSQMGFSFEVSGMLKPGNFKTIKHLHEGCPNISCQSRDTFDIVGNKLITSFREGTIYLLYYADPRIVAENGYYEIPDNEPFKKYLYYYIRFMLYQQLFEQSTDETFNQIKYKRDDAEKRSDTAYINARNYSVSDDIYGVQRRIIRSYNRNNRFRLL